MEMYLRFYIYIHVTPILVTIQNPADKQEIINNLNKHFCLIGQTLSEANHSERSHIMRSSENHFRFKPTKPYKITKTKNLKNSKSIGLDDTSIDVFKKWWIYRLIQWQLSSTNLWQRHRYPKH